MRDVLVGIDLGQTRTKAVLVGVNGRQIAVSTQPTAVSHPRADWAERDLAEMWSRTVSTVRALLEEVDRDLKVVAVGVSGHSDGLYLIDDGGLPVRPAVMATDSRARTYAEELGAGAIGGRLLEVTGQLPMPATPGVLLRWLHDHEPDSIQRSRWILSSTDWLRFMLTGSVATDPTMASAAFTSLDSGRLECRGARTLRPRRDRCQASAYSAE